MQSAAPHFLLGYSMALPDPIDTISTAIADPQSVSADGVAISSRSADDLIKLANYGAMVLALQSRRKGIRRTQLIPPGPTPDCGATVSNTRPWW